jgi:hypothetical protein
MPSLGARLNTNHARMRFAAKRWARVPRNSPYCIRQTNWERRTDLMWIALSQICT